MTARHDEAARRTRQWARRSSARTTGGRGGAAGSTGKWKRLSMTGTVLVLASGALAALNPGVATAASTTYTSAVTQDSPSLYYRLDESADATTATDSSANGLAGVYGTDGTGISFGTPGALAGSTDASDAADSAITLDGSVTQPLSQPTASTASTVAPSGDQPWTMEAWYKASPSTTQNQVIMSIGDGTTQGQHAAMAVWPAANGGGAGYRLAVDLKGEWVQWTGLHLNDNRWHQLAVSYAGGGSPAHPGFAGIVDGAALGAPQLGASSGWFQFPLDIAAGPVRVGWWGDGTYSPMVGSLDEVALYATALPASRVQAHDAASGIHAGQATHVALTVTPSAAPLPADGTATATVTATVTDANGNPVAGDTVTLTSSDTGQAITPAPMTDNGDGTYSATVTSSTAAGTATITATDTSVTPTISGTATLVQSSAAAQTVTLTLAPPSLPADGTSATTATARVVDAHGNPVAGDTVTLGSSDTGDGITPTTMTDTGDGTYTATVTSSTTASAATLTATDGGVTGTAILFQTAPAATTAPACDTSWTNASGGDWSAAGNWSNGVPTTSTVACLPATPGGGSATSYTATINGAAASAKQVLVGSADTATTQTLAISGTGCAGAASLALAHGGVVDKGGIVDLTSSGCGGNSSTLQIPTGSTLTNGGVVESDPGAGGTRELAGTIVNQGSVDVTAGTSFDQAGSTFDNQGTLAIPTGVQFTIPDNTTGSASAVTFANDSGGSISAQGSEPFLMGGGNVFVQGAGSLAAGSTPLVVQGSTAPTTLSITASGATSIDLRSTVDLTAGSTVSSGQTLTVQGVGCGGPATLAAAGSFTNAGTIDLSSTNGCGGDSATLTAPAGALVTSTGIIRTDGGSGGGRYLRASILNTGSVDAEYGTNFDRPGTSFDNQGTLTIPTGVQFTIPDNTTGSASAVTFANDSGGSISAQGSEPFLMGGGNVFVQGAGSLAAGSTPLVVQGSTAPTILSITASGATSIDLRSTVDLTAGSTVSSGQTLTVQGVGCSGPATLAAGGSFSNAGTIDLTSVGCGGGDPATLLLPAGSILTNEGPGVIAADPGVGGDRYLRGSIVNEGIVRIKALTHYDQAGSAFDNTGVLALSGAQLTIPFNGTGPGSAVTFTNGAGGSIGTTGTGNFFMDGGNVYVQGDGALVAGSNPPLIQGQGGGSSGSVASTVDITGGGSTALVLQYQVRLVGDVHPGQTLTVQGIGCSGPSTLAAAGSFSNAGTIDFTSVGCGGDNDYVTTPAGSAMTNTGTVRTDGGAGGARDLRTSIVNQGTVDIETGTTYDQPGTSFDNQGSLAIPSGYRDFTVPFNAGGAASAVTFANNAGGSISGLGTEPIFMDGGNAFVQGDGVLTAGSNPVVVQGEDANGPVASTLSVTGSGALSIDLRFTVDLATGSDVHAGQTLTLQGWGCDGPVALTAAGSFTNAGTIDLSSANGCSGNTATVTGPSGSTLTNAGTIRTDGGSGGGRHLRDSIVNTGTVDAEDGLTYDQAGSTFDNQGTLAIAAGTQFTVPFTSNGPASAVTFTNDTGGSIDALGSEPFFMDGGNTFVQGAGTLTADSTPLVLQGQDANGAVASTLSITGSGATSIDLRFTVDLAAGSDVHAGQTLTLQGWGCDGPATLTAAGSFSNAGIIDLNSANGCSGDVAAVALPAAAVLTNTGTLRADLGSGNGRHITGGTLDNQGTVHVGSGTSLSLDNPPAQVSGSTLSGGQWNLAGDLTWPGATPITTDAATSLTLAGGTLRDSTAGTDELAGLTSVSAGSVLDVRGVTYAPTTTLDDAGTITVDSGGALTPAGYSQAGTGTLSVTLDTSGNAPITVPAGGSATLDGTLALATAAGFDPPTGSRFQVVAGPYSGTFATVTGNARPDQPDYTVDYATDGVYVTADQPTATTITSSSASDTSTYGAAVTVTASVTASSGTPSGTITFSADGSPIDGCTTPVTLSGGTTTAACTTSDMALTAGTHTVTATFADSTLAFGGSAATLTQTVQHLPTATTATGPASPEEYGDLVTVDATVAPQAGAPAGGAPSIDGTGVLSFSAAPDASTSPSPIAGCTAVDVSGGTGACTTTSLPAGTHLVTATYAATANAAGSASTPVTVTVTPRATSGALTSDSATPDTGTPLTITMTVTAGDSAPPGMTPAGTVTFFDTPVAGSKQPLATCQGVTVDANGTATCTTDALAPGAHTLTAIFTDPAGNFATMQASMQQQVGPSALTLSSSATPAAPVTSGSPVTFTATATGTGTLSGTVTFTDTYSGAAPVTLCTGPVSLTSTGAGTATATCTVSTLDGGFHDITATWGGDPADAPATASLGQQVTPRPTTVTLTSSTPDATAGDPVTFTATVDHGTGTVTFTETPSGGTTTTLCSGPVALNAGTATCTVSDLAVGAHAVSAAYSGDTDDAPSTALSTEQVAGQTTTTTLTSNDNPAVSGDTVTFTATVTGGAGTPTGTVTFSTVDQNGMSTTICASKPLAAGSATCDDTYSSAGATAVRAAYAPDATSGSDAPSSTTLAEDVYTSASAVPPTSSTTHLTSSGPATTGGTVTFTATVTPSSGSTTPTGTVTFTAYAADGTSTQLCSTDASTTLDATGTATCAVSSLAAGSYAVTANYPGDANVAASSATIAQAVTVASKAQTQTAVALTTGADPSTVGDALTFTATVTGGSSPSGTVTFSATDSSGTATPLCSGASSAPLGARGTATCAVSNALPAGSYVVTATYSGDGANAGSSGTVAQAVTVASKAQTQTAVALTTGADPSTVGDALTFTATVTGGSSPSGTVTFSATDASGTATPLCSGASSTTLGARGTAMCAVSMLGAGSYVITATYSGDGANAGSSGTVAQAVTVAPKAQTQTAVALTTGADPSTVGDALTFTATVTGGSSPSGTVTFSATDSSGTATPLCSGASSAPLAGVTATCAVSNALPAGSYVVTATYSGDGTNAGSSGTVAQAVTVASKAQTQTAVTRSTGADPSTVGDVLTFTATVAGGSSPTGTVTFSATDSSGTATPLCSGASSTTLGARGTATCTVSSLAAGSYVIAASYPGDGTNAGSSGTVAQTVNGSVASTNPNACQSVALTPSSGSVHVGQSVTLTATASGCGHADPKLTFLS
ncbi:MAG: Ig-like domain repeat protein, partial [Actinomycetota bacterium]|nr:Ig-like domain repeat protein [Actinomycetota bacterium]